MAAKPTTEQRYIRAIKAARGLVTIAAKNLKVTRSAVYDMAARSPEVAKALEEAREETLDFAESKLHQRIKDGDNTAIIFFLKTQGKGRGYIERVETENSGTLEIAITRKVVNGTSGT